MKARSIRKKLYSTQIRILVGIGLVSSAGLFGSYQNFDKVRSIASIPGAEDGGPVDFQEDMASENVTTSIDHTILPSITETISSVESFKIKSDQANDLKVLPSIGLHLGELESIGIISGQKLEAEVNGSAIAVYAYALASSDGTSGISISPSAARDLGAKVGDKIILRALQESPPKLTTK